MLERRIFEDPNYEQQRAWEAINVALSMLAAAYEVDADTLNEQAGTAIEQSVAHLREGRGAA